jgi:hypothetical protein
VQVESGAFHGFDPFFCFLGLLLAFLRYFGFRVSALGAVTAAMFSSCEPHVKSPSRAPLTPSR